MNRAEQFADLCEMVNLCQGLNNGSGIVFKIHRLEEIAKELTRTDWDKPEASFIEWARRKVEEETKAKMNKDFLAWIYDRMIEIHRENPSVDYMIKLKSIVDRKE